MIVGWSGARHVQESRRECHAVCPDDAAEPRLE